jgi:pimeloyl-ACP methyl ester carboxylesterase
VLECARALACAPGDSDLLGHSFGGYVALEPNHSHRGTFVVIGGAGHFPFTETPDRFWPVIAEWLAATSLPR